MADEAPGRVVIVTGLSGAGRSQAAKVLEDVGYFVVDNLPADLVPEVVDRAGVVEGERSRMAVVVDSRAELTAEALEDVVRALEGRGVRTTVLFLDADDAVLVRRFEESRRPHPVGAASLDRAIAEERARFEPIRGLADVIVDTSELNVHQLRERIGSAFADVPRRRGLRVDVTSFGFKRGVPRVVDLLFDVRFLPNPHWDPELRPLTGRDEAVKSFVLGDEEAAAFLDRIDDLVGFLLPRYEREGRSYVTIGVGCTGGRHRSVAIAEALAYRMARRGVVVAVHHRDVGAE